MRRRDYGACDPIAAVAARVGLVVVGLGMDHQAAAVGVVQRAACDMKRGGRLAVRAGHAEALVALAFHRIIVDAPADERPEGLDRARGDEVGILAGVDADAGFGIQVDLGQVSISGGEGGRRIDGAREVS